MIVKVEALFEINEGKLKWEDHPLNYLAQRIDLQVSNDIVKSIIIEVIDVTDRSVLIKDKK